MLFSIFNNTRKPVPKIPFERIKDEILGNGYNLSLVFCGDTLSRRLNKAFRNKDKPTNVLSFPLSDNSGEIFINLAKLKSFSVAELYIHGLLHLKGMTHGSTMENTESKFLKQFFNGQTNNRRY